MITQSAIARHYRYNPQAYSGVLNKIHEKVRQDMENKQAVDEALELQTLLQEVKTTVRLIGKNPVSAIEKVLLTEYQQLIEDAMVIENSARKNNNKTKELAIQAMFNRRNDTNTIQGVDNIFEEELAALEAAIEKRFSGEGNIYNYIAGGQGADVMAVQDKDFTKDIEDKAVNAIQETADALGKKYEAKRILTGRSQKIDNKGISVQLEVGINTGKVGRLAQLLKDATFTDKQYNRWDKNGAKSYMGLQLHLGNTVLYKSITGVVSEVYTEPNIQRAIFFRGLRILRGTKKSPSATPEEVTTHFTHMRFAYELRGTGLIDSQGNAAIAKYIIYNDPGNTNIFVRDTASIILEELERKRSNLFGDIKISASRVRSK